MTHKEFLADKDFYIGKTVRFDEGGKAVIADIKIGGNPEEGYGEDFLCIYVEGGKRPLGGTPEGCHITKHENFTDVSVMYCGGFEIIH